MLKLRIKVSDTIKGLRNAGQLIKTEVRKTLWQQGGSATTYAKQLAPMKTGNLKAGIFFQANNTKLEITSIVPKTFPYNLWVNEDIKTVMLPTTSDFSKTGPRIPRTYASTRHTGTPGYMRLTFLRLNKTFPLALTRNLRKLGAI